MPYDKIEIIQDFWYTEDGANILHRVTVCNRDAVDHRVQIRDYPYDKNRRKIGSRQTKEFTIPAGECRSWMFSINTLERGVEIPAQNYLDVFWWSDLNDAWNIGDFHGQQFEPVYIPPPDLPPAPPGPPVASVPVRQVMVATAYPHRLETIGTPLSMFVRDVRGLPDGWKVTRTFPGLRERFEVTPDEKEIAVLVEIAMAAPVQEGTVLTVEIDIGIDGFEADWVHSMRHKVPFVRDTTPPTVSSLSAENATDRPAMTLMLTAEDRVGALETPILIWSRDDGKTWGRIPMHLTEAQETGPLGLTKGHFEATVILVGWGARVIAAAEVADRLGNMTSTPVESFSGALAPNAGNERSHQKK